MEYQQVCAILRRARHLNSSQRAMKAARAWPVFEETLAQQQKETRLRGKNGGDKKSSSIRSPASEEAAKVAEISSSSVDRARVILAHGSVGLIRLVDRGQLSITAAECVATKWSKAEQQKLVGAGADAVRRESTKIKKASRARRENSPIRLVESVAEGLERLVRHVRSSPNGTPSVRENCAANLRLAKKYVVASRNLFKQEGCHGNETEATQSGQQVPCNPTARPPS